MEGIDHGRVFVYAGRGVDLDLDGFWGRLLDATHDQADVIVDLRGTLALSPRALDLIVYLSACCRLGHSRMGVVADGPTRGMIQASVPPGLLDVASGFGELDRQWSAQ